MSKRKRAFIYIACGRSTSMRGAKSGAVDTLYRSGCCQGGCRWCGARLKNAEGTAVVTFGRLLGGLPRSALVSAKGRRSMR